MPITVTGLRQITKGFKDFEFAGPRIQKRFLTLIGQSTVLLLQQMGPRDTGELNQSWRIVAQGKNYVEVGTDLIGLVSDLELGTSAHVIRADAGRVLRFEVGGQEVFTTEVFHPGTRPNPFIDDVARVINSQVIEQLERALAEGHKHFLSLLKTGGKGRQFQQVGRSSAGFKGGTSFAGRSTLVRAGTGRRQLKRRLSLRRRRGASANKPRREPTIKLG